jgi:uncharacterized DUF497 family protein
VYRWDERKNEVLKGERGVSFEEVILAIESDRLLDVLAHPNRERYPNQRIFVVDLGGYVHLVPFVEEKDLYFLKTIIPSRKATRDYLEGKEENDKDRCF